MPNRTDHPSGLKSIKMGTVIATLKKYWNTSIFGFLLLFTSGLASIKDSDLQDIQLIGFALCAIYALFVAWIVALIQFLKGCFFYWRNDKVRSEQLIVKSLSILFVYIIFLFMLAIDAFDNIF